MTPYSHGSRVAVEKTGIRQPFKDALMSGAIAGWEGCVVLEDMPVCGRKTSPDLVAMTDDGHIALIECKRASSGQAKKGMFEQVLMYGEILSPLLAPDQCAAFETQCQHASNWATDARVTHLLRAATPRTLHLWVVVDRWSGRMDVTALHTWRFLNRALGRDHRPDIKVWAVGGGGSPVDIAAHRQTWSDLADSASTLTV